ncbi:hypothetical protein DID80_08175, partial [Candidatus Marinamargulisbacteria bacterium SCGC AAA071-K20]
MVNAAGAAGITPGQQTQTVNNAQDLINAIVESKDQMQDALQDLSQEMKAPSTSKELGQTSQTGTTGNAQENQQVPGGTFLPEDVPKELSNEAASAFAAAVQGDDEVEKKRKKKKFEEKLEMLAKL